MKRLSALTAALSLCALSACSDNKPAPDGQEVFRFETFGNQGFWTDAMQLPQGIAKAGVTPLQALGLGLNVNVEALSAGTASALLGALEQIGRGTRPEDTVLGNPAVTLALINEGAVIGVVPFDRNGKRKPLGSDPDFKSGDSLDLARGDRIGVSCALCHGRTDDSVVAAGTVGPGSVGKEVDGIVAEGLDVGSIFAASDNPLAYYPFLQLAYGALGGASLGRGDHPGIKAEDSIAEQTATARAYLTGIGDNGLRHYPLTSFDATPDGIGNATYVPPFFRTDLAAPWGSSGSFEKLDDFNNLVYTVALDPTSLLTVKGRAFLNFLAGPVGDEIAVRYEDVLRRTGVLAESASVASSLPFVRVERTDIDAGSRDGPVGRRVNQAKLAALRAYTDKLQSPATPQNLDAGRVALGEALFATPRSMGGAGCINCHKADPGEAVENDQIRALTQLYPRYEDALVTLLNRSDKGITNIQKTTAGPAPEYDLALVVLDASIRGEPVKAPGKKPGYAKPLLLALDSKTEFLHNGSVIGETAVEGLDKLLDPARGADAPHPFYFPGTTQTGPFLEGVDGATGRRALVEYLRSRSATAAP